MALKPTASSKLTRDRGAILQTALRAPGRKSRATLDRLLKANPKDVDALLVRAFVSWSSLGEAAPAERDLKAVLKLQPGNISALTNLAEICRRTGRSEKSETLAKKCLELAPGHMGALTTLVKNNPGKVPDTVLATLNDLAKLVRKDIDLAAIHSLIGSVLDARGDHARAFEHFTLSNRHNPDKYAPHAVEQQLALFRHVFTRSLLMTAPAGEGAGRNSIFIVGLPRSGSTLAEQILLGAPRMESCGESMALPDAVRSLFVEGRAEAAARSPEAMGRLATEYEKRTDIEAGTSRKRAKVVDKMLHNFLNVGFIFMALPAARVLHSSRHPLDTLLSGYCQAFEPGNGFSNSFDALKHYFEAYLGFVRHWREVAPGRVTDIGYEALTAAPEAQGRRLVEAAGAKWSDACLDTAASRRLIQTSSASQANRPIHGASRGRWRRYETQLEPLIKGLGGLAKIEELHRELSDAA